MKKAAIYTRLSTGDRDRQRDDILLKWANMHEIVGEYQDIASGGQGVGDRPGLTKLLEDAAKGEFDVLFCNDVTRFTRQLPSEILVALNKAGVRVVTADGSEIGLAELVAHTFMTQPAKS